MKHSQFINKIKLTEKDFDEIAQKIKSVEEKTSGEIAVAITNESSTYAFWELLAALGTAIILLCSSLPLAPQISVWLSKIFWTENSVHLLGFYFIMCMLCVLFLYFLYNIPFFDRLIIPPQAKNSCVTNRALRYFTESGVYCTKENSGILIFVSYFERQVRIIADKGISAKISQDLWNLIADEMTESLAKNKVKEAYINAIERCGELLQEHFPCDKENENELGDTLVVLEADKWV